MRARARSALGHFYTRRHQARCGTDRAACRYALGRLPFEPFAEGGAEAAAAGDRAPLPALSSAADADGAEVGSGATSIPIRRILWCASTFASIVLNRSGWSIRNCLAFSRP